MTITQWIWRITLILFAISFSIGMVCLFVPKWEEYKQLQAKQHSLSVENANKVELTKQLKTKQERFSTEPAFVERTAREAGMVTKDEVVYKFKDANGKVKNSK